MNYSRFLSRVSMARKPSPIRSMMALLSRSPKIISLAAGAPNVDTFPFTSAEFKMRDGSTLTLDESRMKVALQYGKTTGEPGLIDWLKNLQKEIHKPPTFDRSPEEGGMDLMITHGSLNGLSNGLEAVIEYGDNVLTEDYVYSGTLSFLRPLGCKLLGVKTDKDGMNPDSLRQHLSKWKPSDAKDPTSDIPKVIYTVPNCQNPTGASLTLERKKEIYQIAREYDLLIFEDDPYYFLQFSENPAPTFLELDVDGRVFRSDSFSKIISSGLRLGFISGPAPLIERVHLHNQASIVMPSAMSQILIYDLLQKWGMKGFLAHTRNVASFYENQKNICVKYAKKWVSDLVEFDEPGGSMFIWMKIKGIKDTSRLIYEKALEKEVLLLPGSAFSVDPEEKTAYVRVSYSMVNEEQLDMAFERLASLIKEAQQEGM